MARRPIQYPNKGDRGIRGNRHAQPITLFDDVKAKPASNAPKRAVPMSNKKNAIETTIESPHEFSAEENEMLAAATARIASKKRKRETAETMAAKQKDISVSEFFAKNRH